MELSMASRVLAIGIWTLCDDHGVFEWKPKVIRAEIFPGDGVEIDPLIGELIEHDCIKRFEADGRAYGAVRNFCVYQRPKLPTYRHPFPLDLPSYVGVDRRKAQDDMQASSKPPKAMPKGLPSDGEKPPHRRGEEGREGEKIKTNTESLERVPPATIEAPPPAASETLSQVLPPAPRKRPSLGTSLGAPLPADWVPDEALCVVVKADWGMTDDDIRSELPAFHAFNVQGGVLSQNWDATFILFCKRFKEHRDKQAPPRLELTKVPQRKVEDLTEADWDREVGFYASTGRWTRGIGPDPMSPACKCPKAILERHGINLETGERTIPPRKAVTA